MTTGLGGPLAWASFLAFVLAMLALDLGVFHKKSHEVSFREAAAWSGVWAALALAFGVGIHALAGPAHAVQFLTGYLIEKSLSIDNVFVFVVVFGALGVAPRHQHKVLFWGILSALALRAAMIFGGVALLERFHWLVYVFGAFLVATGVKLYLARNAADEGPGKLLTLAKRVIPSTDRQDGDRFFTMEGAKRVATPLFIALVLVELTDVIFALDSIPAIFAVTQDPFIVFTSNIFALLGLRSLFFLLAGLVHRFRYLKVGLAAVLVFVGAKMALVDWVKVPAVASLGVIALILGASVAVSMWVSRGEEAASAKRARA
jgi:tellurite resistance protein TerC